MSNRKNGTLKFSLFSDFHYLRGHYINTLGDLQAILDRAAASEVDLVIQAGDFCQNRIDSPELDDVYLNNRYGLPVYGIYGNHDMEWHRRDQSNNMKLITPLLTNDQSVIWGTEDGSFAEDGSIAYYYFEANGFRVVCLDSNYSWSAEREAWEHNLPGSWGAPEGNERVNSLAPTQLAWLERVLSDAAERAIPCIVVSHEGFSTLGKNSPDSEVVREIFRRVNAVRRGTVLMAINGHWHTHNIKIEDGVFYLQMNTSRCAAENYAIRDLPPHYPEDMTYDIFAGYGEDGGMRFDNVPLNTAERAASCWYFRDALNAIITVTKDGKIKMEGMETEWLGGVEPPQLTMYMKPYVMSGEWELNLQP